MADSPGESGKRSEGIRLLYKALRGLPEGEQEVVFQYLLERDAGASPEEENARELAPEAPPTVAKRLRVHQDRFRPGWGGPLGPGHQMVPVRLTESQHRRLKEWCAEHNFPMAVVIRGLLERFLDDWEQRAA